MTVNKQLIVQPKVAKNHLTKFVKNLEEEGIKTVFADPKNLGKTKIQTIFSSQNANYVILDKNSTKKLDALRYRQIKILKIFLTRQKKDWILL